MMFRELITNADGATAEGRSTEEHAMTLLRIATRRGYRIEATRQGGMTITRDVHSGGFAPRKHTVTLEPAAPSGKITATVRRDLEAIAVRGSLLENGRIKAGFIYGIPPAASARLIACGLVTVEGTAVSVSLAARLAMCAQDHRATASKPRGYYRDPDHFGPWRHGSCMYARGSVASCPCRWSRSGGDVDDARRYAREHRQQVTADMVRELLTIRTEEER